MREVKSGRVGFVFVFGASLAHFLGVVFTVLFLWYDSLCCKCCCTCCLGEAEIVVFDSSNHEAYLVMLDDGQVSNMLEKQLFIRCSGTS